jgi:hypothetical protein
MTTSPTSNTNTMVLRTKAAHRCFASIERFRFFAIARTMNVHKIKSRRESSNRSEVSTSSTTELSICGNQKGMDYSIRTLFRVERIMGSRYTFFASPLFQNLLFVEVQDIAVAVQHGFGTFCGSLPH